MFRLTLAVANLAFIPFWSHWPHWSFSAAWTRNGNDSKRPDNVRTSAENNADDQPYSDEMPQALKREFKKLDHRV